MQEISIHEFLNINKQELQIIDIRERYEYENGNIEAIHIPMDEILQSTEHIDTSKQVIIYCQTGRRAAAVIYMLNKKYGLNNILNLEGGYSAYLETISNKV
tara:strand:+ start:878 stop:1180 length:303 start_codon:yes stop_codon:yes gene_type:complete